MDPMERKFYQLQRGIGCCDDCDRPVATELNIPVCQCADEDRDYDEGDERRMIAILNIGNLTTVIVIAAAVSVVSSIFTVWFLAFAPEQECRRCASKNIVPFTPRDYQETRSDNE